MLKYKGYTADYYYSKEDELYHGKINNCADLITFESKKEEHIEREFQHAVDGYLEVSMIFDEDLLDSVIEEKFKRLNKGN